MSRKTQFGPEYFRMRNDAHLMRTHAMVDLMNNRPSNNDLLDALSFGFVPHLDHFSHRFVQYGESSDDDIDYDDYDDDDDDHKCAVHPGNSYCGFSRNFLDRGLPKPSKHITPEEAAKNAKELVDEEEKLKRKAEKKKLKKMRQKERRRLEKLEKENANKEKNKSVQVDPGPEKTKHAEKDTNENKIKHCNCSSVPSDPPRTTAAEQISDEEEEEDDDEEDEDEKEDSTTEPEELDMNSCFVSNAAAKAAAIAKRKLEQRPYKKVAPAISNKQDGSEQKGVTKPQKQTDDKKEAESEEAEDANDFITKSVEFAVLGNQYAAKGDLRMAVKYFTEAIKNNPKEYKLFGNRSFCYEKMRLYAKALTDAEIALSMNPKWIKGLYRKGKALVGLKKYYDARVTYSEVLKLDQTCKDAAEELMRVQIMQLMELGFTKEQSSNALIIHGTVEKALEALTGIQAVAPAPRESEFMPVQRNSRAEAKFPLRPVPQNQPRPNMPVPAAFTPQPRELFPVWVGDLVPSITGEKLYELFKSAGPVHNVRVLPARFCAFVNYTSKEDCERAIRDLHGYRIDGTILVVRYPDRIHTHLGVSRSASTETSGKNGKQPDECYFWRTTGCIKNDRCTYRHIPENKGVDQHKARSHY